MLKKTTVRLFVGTIATALLIASCGTSDTGDTSESNSSAASAASPSVGTEDGSGEEGAQGGEQDHDRETVEIVQTVTDESLGATTAWQTSVPEELGYFADEGLEVEIQASSEG